MWRHKLISPKGEGHSWLTSMKKIKVGGNEKWIKLDKSKIKYEDYGQQALKNTWHNLCTVPPSTPQLFMQKFTLWAPFKIISDTVLKLKSHYWSNLISVSQSPWSESLINLQISRDFEVHHRMLCMSSMNERSHSAKLCRSSLILRFFFSVEKWNLREWPRTFLFCSVDLDVQLFFVNKRCRI